MVVLNQGDGVARHFLEEEDLPRKKTDKKKNKKKHKKKRIDETDRLDESINELERCVQDLMSLIPTIEGGLDELGRIEKMPTAAPTLPTADVAGSHQQFVLRIRDKFEDADPALVERLGHVSWKRFIQPQDKVHGSLDPEMPPTDASILAGEEIESKSSSTFKDSALGSSIPPTSEAGHTDPTTRYAIDKSNQVNRIPPQSLVSGLTFHCTICGQSNMDIQTYADWE